MAAKSKKEITRKKGFVHIYTGDGKGKTTAAFGLAVRAAGSGLKVCIYQFMKGPAYNENIIFKKIGGITFRQCGRNCFIKGRPLHKDIAAAHKGFDEICSKLKACKYDMLILDEINVALKVGILDVDDIKRLIADRPSSLELVLTGRGCPKSLYKYADLITEMRKIKHPFDKGVWARKGIEF